MFKFDLKKGCHHVDIFDEYQTYLGFRSGFRSVFTVIPFELSAAPFVFTKMVRPLIRYWRLHAIRIAYFFKNGLGTEFEFSKSETTSKFVLNTLVNAGFVTNKEKPAWEPIKILAWLGISVNFNKRCLYVSKECI